MKYDSQAAEEYLAARQFFSVTGRDSHFSHTRCPACGGLPGDRRSVSFVEEGTIDETESICTDCVFYFTYGELPE